MRTPAVGETWQDDHPGHRGMDTVPPSLSSGAMQSGSPHGPGCTCKSCMSRTLIFCPDNGLVAHATGRLAAQVRELLRIRLIQSALIIGGGITAFGIFGWVSTGWVPWPMLGVPLISAAAALILHLRQKASPVFMRVTETVIFLGSAALLTLAPTMAALAPAGSPGFLDPNLAVYRTSVAILGLMVVYGMFVPNSFGRAALFLAVMLMAPVLVPVVCSFCLPVHAPGVEAEHLSYNLMLLLIGAAVSAFGAHTLSSMRSEAAHMQEGGMYRLTEKIGQGGMGEVWKAEHRLLARPAAIKMIRPELIGFPDRKRLDQAIARFRREARITASLRSPHTVSLFDFGVTCHGTFFYVMEYLDGLDLEQLVRRFGPQPADRVAFLVRQAAESLAEAHERGLVHRDVKPSNLHVGRVGVRYDFLKVLDFGLVKVQDGDGGDLSRLTVDGVTTGTPAFMAPELALGRPEIDHRVDIYALGCVAYWLLTGLLVFEGATPVEIVVNHVRSAPIPPSRRCEMPIPNRFEELVMACLAKEPDQRPQDLASVCREIDESGLAQTWTQARAREWWQNHLPG